MISTKSIKTAEATWSTLRHRLTTEAKNNPQTIRLRNSVAMENEGLVHHVCHRFEWSEIEYEDLYQIGFTGLIKAVERYEPGCRKAFSSFAIPYISGAIMHFLRDHGTLIKIPRSWREAYAKGKSAISAGSDPATACGVDNSTWLLIESAHANQYHSSLDELVEKETELELLSATPSELELTAAKLAAVVEKLPKFDRQIVKEIFENGKSAAGVAHQMGIPLNQLQERVEILRQHLMDFTLGVTQTLPEVQNAPHKPKSRFKLVKVSTLKLHPLNENIYGVEDRQDLIDKIRESGWVAPLVIAKRTNHIIHGNSRYKACIALGIEEVWTEIIDYLDENAELEALLTGNVTRPKTNYQKLQEAKYWEQVEKAKAKARQSGASVAESEKGTTRDAVAAIVGLGSGANYGKGKWVLETIEQMERSHQQELIACLNKSINSAYNKLKKPSQTRKPKVEKVVAQFLKAAPQLSLEQINEVMVCLNAQAAKVA